MFDPGLLIFYSEIPAFFYCLYITNNIKRSTVISYSINIIISTWISMNHKNCVRVAGMYVTTTHMS